VITAAGVTRIQGDVASPAALKKQLDELKQDVDKRFHTVQTLLASGITIATAILITQVKGCADKQTAASAVVQQPQAPAIPAAVPKPQTPASSGRDSLGRQGQKGGGR
jgi:hypothetical protein